MTDPSLKWHEWNPFPDGSVFNDLPIKEAYVPVQEMDDEVLNRFLNYFLHNSPQHHG